MPSITAAPARARGTEQTQISISARREKTTSDFHMQFTSLNNWGWAIKPRWHSKSERYQCSKQIKRMVVKFSSTSHLLLGRKWKHNWGKILQMPQISAFNFQQLKATSAHPSNHTLPVALLLAWDIWKVSDTGNRILHPATAQSNCFQPASHLHCHGTLGRVRCQSTKYSISSNAAVENKRLYLPASSPCPCLPK